MQGAGCDRRCKAIVGGRNLPSGAEKLKRRILAGVAIFRLLDYSKSGAGNRNAREKGIATNGGA
jgi:hypothetical protein